MQHVLINLNPDLKRLDDEGYQLEIRGAHLLVHHIPYLNSELQIKYGILVCVLTLSSTERLGRPANHTIFFIGEIPHNKDRTIIPIINNSNNRRLTESIIVNHYFSSKPPTGNFLDYYEKVRTYAEILSSQAKAIDSNVTEKPNRIKAA